MKPFEARVLIIDDIAKKRDGLTTVIEQGGGQVVGTAVTLSEAYDTVSNPDFPDSAGNPNVVLIDGYLGSDNDGQRIFNKGYSRAFLHRADSTETIGAVAIGCSADDDSSVRFATGNNFSRLYADDVATRWARLLEPHPADPDYVSRGTLERAQNERERSEWPGFVLPSIMEHLPPSTEGAIHFMHAEETRQKHDEPGTHGRYIKDITSPVSCTLTEFIGEAAEWQRQTTEQDVPEGFDYTRALRAMVQFGDDIYVLGHQAEMHQWTTQSTLFLLQSSNADKIDIGRLHEIPDSYWQNADIERPEIVS